MSMVVSMQLPASDDQVYEQGVHEPSQGPPWLTTGL